MDDETNYDVWVTEVVGSVLNETLALDPTMPKEDGVMKSVIQMWEGLNGLSVVAIVVLLLYRHLVKVEVEETSCLLTDMMIRC